ncbi:UNVERIFIED_ORG: hypothetical protein B5F06_01485 [Lacrimispora saccharolytica]|nr:hypothetical protein CLOM621_07449 [Clostridium sp. M62/1]
MLRGDRTGLERKMTLMRTRTQGRCCLKATALGASVRQGAHFFIFGKKWKFFLHKGAFQKPY